MDITKATEGLPTSDFPTSRIQLSTSFRIGESFITFYASLAIAYHYLMKLLLRSHQASQQTNSGRVRDQPGLPVPQASLIWDFWMYVCGMYRI